MIEFLLWFLICQINCLVICSVLNRKREKCCLTFVFKVFKK